ACNARRAELPGPLRPPPAYAARFGAQSILGMPFVLGPQDDLDVVLLDGAPVTLDLGDALATYVLFVHAAEDVVTSYRDGFADGRTNGLNLGDLVSEYHVEHVDGASTAVAIR